MGLWLQHNGFTGFQGWFWFEVILKYYFELISVENYYFGEIDFMTILLFPFYILQADSTFLCFDLPVTYWHSNPLFNNKNVGLGTKFVLW